MVQGLQHISLLLNLVHKYNVNLFLHHKEGSKFGEADLIAYALNTAEAIDANQEPCTYLEGVSCNDSKNMNDFYARQGFRFCIIENSLLWLETIIYSIRSLIYL